MAPHHPTQNPVSAHGVGVGGEVGWDTGKIWLGWGGSRPGGGRGRNREIEGEGSEKEAKGRDAAEDKNSKGRD